MDDEVAAFKLFRVRADGSIGSLFMDTRRRLPLGEWMPAENHARKGFAERPGWHAAPQPAAPHLSVKGRRWFRVLLKDVSEYSRPESQGGTWLIADSLKIVGPADAGL